MPIANFSSFAEQLVVRDKGHGHLVTNVDFNDDRKWVEYAESIWFQPLGFNLSAGNFSLVLKAMPGAVLGVHYHVGAVQGYTIAGHWGYLEYDWTAKPGTFIFEPPGEAHTLVIREDSPEPAMIFFMIEGGLIYLDKPVDGGFAAYEDSFSALEYCRTFYRQKGMDENELDVLVR